LFVPVIVLMVRLEMAVRMRVAGTVRMLVFVLVEHDLQAAPKGIGNAAQGSEARNMIAALEPRDHRLGHAKSLGELLLRLTRASAQLEQTSGALRSDCNAVIGRARKSAILNGLLHCSSLANLRSQASQNCEGRVKLESRLCFQDSGLAQPGEISGPVQRATTGLQNGRWLFG
jgi:hypothetical protein